MGCGCNKKKTNERYKYVAPDKKVVYYNSVVEAKAAVIRSGGTYKKVV